MPRASRASLVNTSCRFRTLVLLLLLHAYPALAGDVVLEGVDGELAKSLRAGLGINTLNGKASPVMVRRRHAIADQELRTGLQAFGYYQPTISKELDLSDTKKWVARYVVDPGPRHVWAASEIQLTAETDAPPPWLVKSREQAAKLVGQGLDHREYEKLKSQLIDSAENTGYLDAMFEVNRLEIDREKGTAQARLVLNSGPQYRFGKVRIAQNILDDDFLQRFNPISEGELFSTDKLLDLRLRLYDLNYFRTVNIRSARQAEYETVDIDIQAEEKPPQRWQIGLGYGTDTGPRISSAVEFRYLNRRGHAADAEARVSEVKTELGIRYTLPTGPEPGANWAFRSQRLTEKLGDTVSTTLRTGLSRNRVFGQRLVNYYLNYEGERFTFSGELTQTDLVIPGVSLTVREKDDLLLPRKGYSFVADVHGSSDAVLSSTSFVQTQLNANWIHPLSSRSRLLVRGRAAANWLSDLDELPASQRFFAGGDNSIRGYDYRRIAPRDSNNDVIGGKYLQTASIEVDRLLWRDYGVAIFHDIGSASNSWLQGLVSSTGIGFRWATVVGMVRVDIAVPHDDDDTRFQLHIGIGGEL